MAGAGPAGAAFATYVAAAAYDVVLVDRARFPRDKVCGDFVGAKTTPPASEQVQRASARKILGWPLAPGSRPKRCATKT